MRRNISAVVVLVALVGAGCASERGPLTNRLTQTGPRYLARGARQPVSWQPWGPDAFALAARLDRPVLLSIGAEDCRWCVQMDREAYADPAVAAAIDSLFVPVRVDRDERPDLAQRYETAVLSLAGLRGYPITLFLTPDGSAFFGGTYFPADDPITGRGLKQVLPDVARSYHTQRAQVLQKAALVRQLAVARAAAAPGVPEARALRAEIVDVRDAIAQATRRHALGGFLHTQACALLLGEFGRDGDTLDRAVARRALDAMIDSGVVMPADAPADDPPGLVRAGMLRNLAVGWALTGDVRYRDAARTLIHALTRDLAATDERAVFADRESYVIGSVLEAAVTVGDSASERASLVALDSLLRRVYRPGRGVRHAPSGSVHGLLQDQVQVAGAALAAFDASGDSGFLAVAKDLAAVLDRDFADPAGGYYDEATPDPAAPALADRTKQVLDDLLPGANAWAARFFLRLADVTGDVRYRRRADATLEAFAGAVRGQGVRASSYLAAARTAFASP